MKRAAEGLIQIERQPLDGTNIGARDPRLDDLKFAFLPDPAVTEGCCSISRWFRPLNRESRWGSLYVSVDGAQPWLTAEDPSTTMTLAPRFNASRDDEAYVMCLCFSCNTAITISLPIAFCGKCFHTYCKKCVEPTIICMGEDGMQ